MEKKKKIQAKYLLKHPGWNGDYRKLLPQTYAQYALYGMFLLDIHAEMVRTWIYSHNTCMLKYCLQELLPQTNTQYISVVCFSHTSRSHRDLPQQTYAQYMIVCWMFLLYIQAEIVLTGNYAHKPMLSLLYRMFLLHIQAQTLSRRCFSYNPGWNGACGELLQLTKPLTTNPCPVCSPWEVSLTHAGSNGAYGELSHKSMPAYGKLSHKPMPTTISKGHFS